MRRKGKVRESDDGVRSTSNDEHNQGRRRRLRIVRRTVRLGLADQIEFLNLVRPPSCLALVVLAKRGRKEEEEREKKEEEGKEDGGSPTQPTKLSSTSSEPAKKSKKKITFCVDHSAFNTFERQSDRLAHTHVEYRIQSVFCCYRTSIPSKP